MDDEDLYLQQPLMWTSKGNLPVSELRCVPQWTDSSACVQLVLEYFLGDELVRRDVHNYMRGV